MTSLGYSDFSAGASAATTNAQDGYIAAKRKNKTIKSFDSALKGGGGANRGDESSGTAAPNPKLERLKQSIARIHAASSDEEDEDDGPKTNMLPTYPGQGMGQTPQQHQQQQQPQQQQQQHLSAPIADAGSGVASNMLPPPTTSEGRTHQPMFSMSQQSASRNIGNGGGLENFAMKMPSTYAAQYYKQYVPYNKMSNDLSSAGANSDELIEKLNYIVHLLEEQHNERTENVTEELVLYCFLGVFIIFVVDSFARAGKYTR
jgi:hypothetical protein